MKKRKQNRKKKPAAAQTNPVQASPVSDTQAVTLDPIDVSGAYWSIGILPGGLVGSSIERPAFEEMPIGLRVEDIVKRLPAITTGGAAGEDKDARVLGIDKEYTRVTVDGLAIPDGGEKREFNLDRLPSTFIESVTVHRLRSADMEADGLAGRVDIKLRPIPVTPQADVIASYGGLKSSANDSHLASIIAGGRINSTFGAQIGVAHSRIPGVKTKDKSAATGRLSERETENKPNDATDIFGDFGIFGDGAEFHLKPKFLELDENKTKRKDKYTGTGASNGYELEDENKVKRTFGGDLSGKATIDAWNGALVDGRVSYFETSENKKEKNKYVFRANGTEDTAKREWETEDKTDAVAQVEGNIAVPFTTGTAFTLTPKTGYLVRHRNRERDKTKIVGVTPSVDPKEDYRIEELIAAAYVQNTIGLGSRISMTPGVRFENAALDVTAGSGVSSSSSQFDVLPSLPIEVKLRDDLTLSGGVSRLLNRPKFDELSPYENDSNAAKIVIGNPALRPAKAWAYEAYLRYQIPHFTFGAGVSYRDIKDVIEAVFTGEVRNGKDVEQVKNVGDGWVRAFILEQRLDLAFLAVPVVKDITISANQTFTESQLVTSDGISRRFKEQPPFFGNLTVDWRDPRLGTSISVGLGFTSPFINEDSNERRAAETYLDVKVTQRLTGNTELFVLAQNLTDQQRTKFKANGEIEVEAAGPLVMAGVKGKF